MRATERSDVTDLIEHAEMMIRDLEEVRSVFAGRLRDQVDRAVCLCEALELAGRYLRQVAYRARYEIERAQQEGDE